MSKQARTSNELRRIMFEELDALRSGESTPSRARAVANLGNAIVGSLAVEFDFRKSAPDVPNVGELVLAETDPDW